MRILLAAVALTVAASTAVSHGASLVVFLVLFVPAVALLVTAAVRLYRKAPR
jgi:uncharacterized membrane protein